MSPWRTAGLISMVFTRETSWERQRNHLVLPTVFFSDHLSDYRATPRHRPREELASPSLPTPAPASFSLRSRSARGVDVAVRVRCLDGARIKHAIGSTLSYSLHQTTCFRPPRPWCGRNCCKNGGESLEARNSRIVTNLFASSG